MRTIPATLLAHMQQNVTSLATCWTITRKDTAVLNFTDHDRGLTVGADWYNAVSGYESSNVEYTSDMSVDSIEVVGLLSDTTVTEADIAAGLYDDAEVTIFMVNHEDTTMGQLNLRRGWIGEIRTERNQYIAELRGLTQRLQQEIGEVYTPTCRAAFGDSRCKYNNSTLHLAVTLNTLYGSASFASSALIGYTAHAFTGGYLQWTTGNNAGTTMEINWFTNGDGRIYLFMPPAYPMQVGDVYEAWWGCDKSFNTCVTRYGNLINFRGEPYIPGADDAVKYVTRS